jgi:hypothetical protein
MIEPRLGCVHEAIDLLERVVARDPLHDEDLFVHLGLGMLYTLQGMTQDAIAIREKGVKVLPWSPLFWGPARGQLRPLRRVGIRARTSPDCGHLDASGDLACASSASTGVTVSHALRVERAPALLVRELVHPQMAYLVGRPHVHACHR